MEYTIKEVAEISELSIRTLLFYEKRGLLMPADLDGAGYRRYAEKEMDKLQQILLPIGGCSFESDQESGGSAS